jgi:glycosyltransferase involved in cell wall biosynthesis
VEGGLVPSSFGFLGTYPPTQCGLATFSRDLMRSIATAQSGDRAGIVRVVDVPTGSVAPEVVGHLHALSAGSHVAAADALNTFDVAVIQHDYGIYGGQDGDQLLAVLDRLEVPVVVVAHSVLENPTPHQAEVMQRVIDASDAVVTLSEAARERLARRYQLDAKQVRVIQHGAHMSPGGADVPMPGRRPLIVTWGLLGPGKGIEWAIDGLQRLQRLRPLPAYIVAGQTHPVVRRNDGENYRLRLGQRARAVGVSHLLRFEASYLAEAELARLIRRADVVLVPYDSREQVSSGVLVEAVAAGKAIVATAFPHAVELLGDGAGLLVPQFDGAAMGEALYRVLTEPVLANRLREEAAALAPRLQWPTVAAEYRSLAGTLLANRTPAI